MGVEVNCLTCNSECSRWSLNISSEKGRYILYAGIMLPVLVALYIAVKDQIMMFSDPSLIGGCVPVSAVLPYNWDECLTGEGSLNYKE